MRIASNAGVAAAATSGFLNIRTDVSGIKVNLGSSNIGSMKNGAKLANELVDRVSGLVAEVQAEADRVNALAGNYEARDAEDASGFGIT